VQRPSYDAKGVTCVLESNPASLTGNTFVLGDRHRLRQIVDNLLSNALKFSPPGSQVTVRLDIRRLEAARALENFSNSSSSRHLINRSSVLSASSPSKSGCGCFSSNRATVVPESSTPVASGDSSLSVRETLGIMPWKASTPVHSKTPTTDYCVVTIDVEDHGIGIPEAGRKRLFTPFTQINAGANQQGAGTGLGLAICRQLARSHHGDVTCMSEEGVGSTFTLTFQAEMIPHDIERHAPALNTELTATPINAYALPDCKDVIGVASASVDASSVSRQRSASQFTHLEGKLGAGRVLVVDDVTSNRVLLAKLLHRYGYATSEADGGVSALNFFNHSPRKDTNPASNPVSVCTGIPTPTWCDNPSDVPVTPPFDAVFLDRHMPGMSGEALAAAIRATGYTGVLIGVTGDSHDTYDSFLKAGVDYILCKPITMKTLQAALQALHKLPHP
jgi:CheY-like chemotaxis protein